MTAITTADERHEEASRADVIEALGHLCSAAKRLPCVIGTPELPTPYDRAHVRIDETLTMLEAM